ncbi:hypothetical protein [Methanococcus sp. CF]
MNGEFFLILIVSQVVLWIFASKLGLGKSVSFVFGFILLITAFYRFLYIDPLNTAVIYPENNFEIIKNGIINCKLSLNEFLTIAIIPWIGILYNSYFPKLKRIEI